MIPGAVTDSSIVQHAGHHWLGDLLASGVEIYEHQPTLDPPEGHDRRRRLVARRLDQLRRPLARHQRRGERRLIDERVAGELLAAFERDLAASRRLEPAAWADRSALASDRPTGSPTWSTSSCELHRSSCRMWVVVGGRRPHRPARDDAVDEPARAAVQDPRAGPRQLRGGAAFDRRHDPGGDRRGQRGRGAAERRRVLPRAFLADLRAAEKTIHFETYVWWTRRHLPRGGRRALGRARGPASRCGS